MRRIRRDSPVPPGSSEPVFERSWFAEGRLSPPFLSEGFLKSPRSTGPLRVCLPVSAEPAGRGEPVRIPAVIGPFDKNTMDRPRGWACILRRIFGKFAGKSGPYWKKRSVFWMDGRYVKCSSGGEGIQQNFRENVSIRQSHPCNKRTIRASAEMLSLQK